MHALASGALRIAGGALKLAVAVMSLFTIALISDGLMHPLDWPDTGGAMHWLATGLTALFITLWMLFGAAVAWQLSLALTLIGGLIGGGAGALAGFLMAGAAGFVLSARKMQNM